MTGTTVLPDSHGNVFRPVVGFCAAAHGIFLLNEQNWHDRRIIKNKKKPGLSKTLLLSPVCLISKTYRTTLRSEAPPWEKSMSRPSFKPLFDTCLWRGSCVTYQSQRHHVTYPSTEQGVQFTAQLPSLSWSCRTRLARSETHRRRGGERRCSDSHLVLIF